MDDVFLKIKALEQRVIDLLQIYKLCNTIKERQEIQQLILNCEFELERIRGVLTNKNDAPEMKIKD